MKWGGGGVLNCRWYSGSEEQSSHDREGNRTAVIVFDSQNVKSQRKIKQNLKIAPATLTSDFFFKVGW